MDTPVAVDLKKFCRFSMIVNRVAVNLSVASFNLMDFR